MANLKDSLLDIVKVVSTLPFEIVKVTGNDGTVTLQSKLQDESSGAVVFSGTLKNPQPELDGVFGLSNISMLVGLTNVESFRDKEATVSLKRLQKNDVSYPEEIVFEKDGFGKASYRLTGEKAIPPQMKAVASITWDVEIDQPVKRKIAEFAQLAGIYSTQETRFSVKTENRQLKFLIGDESSATHKAQVVFAEGVTGTIKPNHTWNVAGILSVLKLGSSADMTMKISSQGILQIEVDTGIGKYTFLFAGSN